MAEKLTVSIPAKADETGQQAAAQMAALPTAGQGEFLLYQTEDAQTRIQLRLDDGTVWMSQKQLAELYQVAVPTINAHLRGLFQDGELMADRTIRKFLIVARKDILTHAGKVSADAALAKAQAAYAEYQARVRNLPSPVEKDFEAAIAQPVKLLEKGRKTLPKKKKAGTHE